MIQILGRVNVADFSRFIGIFSTRGAAMRRKHGCRRARLYRLAFSPTEVALLFDWESREAFDAFLADPEVKETMKASGVTAPPEFTFLEHIAEFPN